MTGWRLGYAAGPKPLIAAMALLQGQSTSNPASIIQKAALAALELSDEAFKPMIEAFRKRRDRMAEIFASSKLLSFVRPAGAFYFFLNIESVLGKAYNHDQVLGSSEELAFYLLNAAHVGTVAGSGFGAEGYLRLSFAVSDSEIEEGSKRIVETLEHLK
jgi:aspartate aminotransferase